MAFKMKYKKAGFPFQGDYDMMTGQRLSQEEADDLIKEEGAGSVRSTYQDAVNRAKTPEEKAAAEAKMAELSETGEGKKLIEADAAETENLKGEWDEGRVAGEPEFVFATDQPTEGELVEGWAGDEGVDKLTDEDVKFEPKLRK